MNGTQRREFSVRVYGVALLLFAVGFCVFGYLTTLEPMADSALAWRIGYGAVGVASFVGAIMISAGAVRIFRTARASVPKPTEAELAAAKPWLRVLAVTWGLEMLSYAGLGLYVWLSAKADLRIITVWFGLAWLAHTVSQSICFGHLQQIRGESLTRGYWLSVLWRLLFVATLVYFAWK